MSQATEVMPPDWDALARELAPLVAIERTFWLEDFCADFHEVE